MLQIGTSPSLGDSIGRYRLIAELARGGMGIVYVAASQGPGGFSKLVAIKELKPELAHDGDFLTMFLDEARLAARLNHPNIVQTNDVDEHDGRHFIAMEYLEGRSLYHAQKRFLPKGGLPQRVSLTILRDVLAALDYAHELTGADGKLLGFVHRDISPHNVFLTFDGHTKVIDFGIAKARDSSLETKTGVLKGRVSYMAPEQLQHSCDRRSDVFSVGVILAEVILGKRLWHGLNDMEILSRLVRGDIPALPETGLPAQLVDICRTALQPRPDDRYATAALMRDALDDYLWTQGGSPRPREISTVLLREFEPERKRRRELVEGALARLQAGEGGQLTTLAVPESRDLETGTHRPSPIQRVASVVAPLPRPPVTEPSLPGLTFDEPKIELLPKLKPRHNKMLIGAGAGALFVTVVLVVALPHSAPPPAPASPHPTAMVTAPVVVQPPPPPVAPPVPRVQETIVLSVSVVPSNAQFFIDGELMPSNPFLGRFPKSNAQHRLRAVAPGYAPKERLVSFADNVMIDLNLALVPHPAPPPPPPARRESRRPEPRHADPPPTRPAAIEAPVAPAPPPAAPARAVSNDIQPRAPGESPRRRQIDATNPYGEDQ